MKTLLLLFVMAPDSRIPERLPVGQPLIKAGLREGYYKVKGKNYTSLALVTQPKDTNIYLVFQYSGKQTQGVGFFAKDTLIFHWDAGVMSVQFKNGIGHASWVANPGNGQVNHETWTFLEGLEDE